MLALGVISALLLLAGVIALIRRQPYGVWYGLLWPGALGLVVAGANLIVLMRLLQSGASGNH